jgi:amidophosphoribosyltransferase
MRKHRVRGTYARHLLKESTMNWYQNLFVWSFLLLFVTTIKPDEEIGHECGLALVRLRKPLQYYQDTYGSVAWGAHKLCALLEEQRHRGQNGAGIALMKFDMQPGQLYLQRLRNAESNAIDILLQTVLSQLPSIPKTSGPINEIEYKEQYEFLGEIYLGHVRYGTHSGNGLSCCQPYLCKNSVASKNFALAGNFNMTNSKELCLLLTEYGLTPTSDSDTRIILELISYYLNQEHVRLAHQFGLMQKKKLTELIAQEIDIVTVLRNACVAWDGGYVFAGILGNGDAFVCRDPAGIRPGFFYVNDEVIAAASERSALVSVFDVDPSEIQEIKAGHVLVIKQDNSFGSHQFTELLPLRQCSFERIYFSKASDPAIYQERKALGKNLAQQVMQALGDDIEHAVFAYIPNSSESAFIGLVEELNLLRPTLPPVRVEKLVYKNQRLRTFIAQDADRKNNSVARLYTATRGIVTAQDTLVLVDDSIVRGTTLRDSIVKELSRLNPKRIIFVSSAPPVLYPDCYGIDMSQIGNFIAFQAAVALLKQENKAHVLESIRDKCEAQKDLPSDQMINYVQELYQHFTLDQLAAKIVELARPFDLSWQGEFQIIYQTVDGLHSAMPEYSGDWYFTGNYPTPGGYKVLNTSFVQWSKGSNKRAY